MDDINIGSIVYESGGAFDDVRKVSVNEKNHSIIKELWNSFYFDSYEDAIRATNHAHEEYNDYLGRAIRVYEMR